MHFLLVDLYLAWLVRATNRPTQIDLFSCFLFFLQIDDRVSVAFIRSQFVFVGWHRKTALLPPFGPKNTASSSQCSSHSGGHRELALNGTGLYRVFPFFFASNIFFYWLSGRRRRSAGTRVERRGRCKTEMQRARLFPLDDADDAFSLSLSLSVSLSAESPNNDRHLHVVP